MTDQPGCGCNICAANWQLTLLHDYVWEGDDEQDVRGEV